MNPSSLEKSPLILVADDDSSTRIILRLILVRDGYQVIETQNGQECLDAFISHQPDIVLLDAMMPVMDGFTCCQKLQEFQLQNNNLGNTSSVPVLIITGLDDQKSVDLAFESGAIDYVTKPIHRAVLRRRLRYLLEARWAEEALRKEEEKYRLVVNNLREGIFQIDLEDELTFLNPAWEKITGFPVSESLGKKLSEFIYPQDLPIYKTHLKSLLMEQSQESRFSLRYLTNTQELGWMEIYACRMENSDRVLTGIWGTIDDITKRKRREIYQKVEYKITKVLAESPTINDAVSSIIRILCYNLGWQLGEFWCLDSQENIFQQTTSWHFALDKFAEFLQESSCISLPLDHGLPSRIWQTSPILWIDDLTKDVNFVRTDLAIQANLLTGFGFLVFNSSEKLGVITLFSTEKKQTEPDFLKIMKSLGSQIGQFVKRKQAEIQLQQQHLILQSELNQAADYVRSLLPTPLDEKVVSIQQLFIPSIDLGGDIFDYYWLDEEHLVIYLLDVAGHGVRPALLSVSVCSLLRSQSLYNTDFYEPWTVITELNRMFQMDEKGENYFTIWYGVYNQTKQELVYCSAAHPPALLLSYDQTNQILVKQLSNDNIAVGMLPEFEFEQSSCSIIPGSSLYIFSDGVYEIEVSEGKIWGFNAFVETIKNYYQNSSSLSNQKTSERKLEKVLEQIQLINPQDTLDDDFSIIELDFPISIDKLSD